MRTAVAVLSVLFLTAACGGDGDAPSAEPGTPTSSAETADPTGSTTPPAAGSGSSRILLGTVGESDDPETFTIAVRDSSGEPVSTVPAGTYVFRINDFATIHNFRLVGPGVDESTEVGGTGKVTWEVRLQQGSYTFQCDPHAATMTGTIEVS